MCAQNQFIEYSQIRHICNGVLLNHNPQNTWVFAMSGYSVYIDDAGHPEDKPYLVVAGFLASEEKWLAFEKCWNEVLELRGIPLPFHATDFMSKHKADPKLKYLIADLVRVITNHVEGAFSVCIDMEAYKSANRETRLEEVAGTPYAMGMRIIYWKVEEWQKVIGPRSPLLYFVENGSKHKGDMLDCIRDRDRMVPPIAVPKDNVGCQAADLYAHAVYQTAVQGFTPTETMIGFIQKMNSPRERMDMKVFEPELAAYLASRSSVIHTETYPDGIKVSIPKRSETDGFKFNFAGNKNKLRRSSVGIPKPKR